MLNIIFFIGHVQIALRVLKIKEPHFIIQIKQILPINMLAFYIRHLYKNI